MVAQGGGRDGRYPECVLPAALTTRGGDSPYVSREEAIYVTICELPLMLGSCRGLANVLLGGAVREF